jgi:hypothetical protein
MGAFFNIGPIGGLVAGVLRSGEPVLVFPRDRALNRIKENRLDAGRKSTRRAEPNEVRAAERSVRLLFGLKLEIGYFGELAEGLNNFCPFIWYAPIAC